jgi:hypothetical protein
MRPLLLTALLFAAGCAPDLREDFPFDGELPDGDYVTFEPQDDGGFLVRVDATRKESWVYVDMVGQKYVKAADAVGSSGWDLAFQRFKVISNSGVSGPGEVEVAVLPGQSFEELTVAPKDGYVRDAEDGPDGNGDLDSAFLVDDGWYSYSLVEHKLASRDVTYAVKARGSYFKLRMVSYYDEAGSAGRLRLRWGKLNAPPP